MSLADKNSKILVTGGSGYLGSNILCHLYKAGYKNLTGLSRSTPDKSQFDFNVKWIELDILDVLGLEDAFSGQDIIIHTAGLVSYQHGDKKKLFSINMTGTANVVNCALVRNIKHLVHISSTAALGIPEQEQIITEKYMPDPSQFLTDYALSKWYAELEVWRGIHEGLQAAIISPSLIIGSSSMPKKTDIFIQNLKAGLKKCPSGTTGLVHHSDVCKAVIHAVDHVVNDKKYILSADSVKWCAFLKIIASNLNLKQTISSVSNTEINLLAASNFFRRIFRIPITVPTSYARQMMKTLQYDGSAITRDFDFQYTDLQTTISDYCHSDS